MRVLFLTPLYIPWVGGLENFVRQLSRTLQARGHEVAIITSHGREAAAGLDEVDNVPVRRISAHDVVRAQDAAGILRAQVDIVNFARRFAPDVVHSHDPGPVLWLYHRAARRDARPLMVTLHNTMTRAAERESLPVLAKLIDRADWVTGVSEAVVDDALTYAPSVASRISVIRNGVVPESEASPVPDGPPRLLCIGRLVEQKGFDLAIAALAMLRSRHPSARLTIAGDGPEGARLVALASDLDVADRVEFLGIVDRAGIARLLRETTVVVMPSRYEGFPLVALEAAWAGRPVIASEAPGLAEAVRRTESGIIVPGEDVGALAGAIDELVSDRERARALGRRARAMAGEQYAIGPCVDAYERLYHRLMAT